jgi:hypothetical protein
MQDIEFTLVVFRRFKDGGDIIALFPEEIADAAGNCMSYQHIGQHGAADYSGCIAASVPASDAEFSELKRELEAIGYRLKVRRRRV